MEGVSSRTVTDAVLALAIAMTAPVPAGAERLAVHTMTVAEGLAGDQVNCIVRDSEGFLWIGTRTGLSRFDGVRFRSFDTRDGLPDAAVHAVVESADGTLWVGTGLGLSRMRAERDATGTAFDRVPAIDGSVSALAEDANGTVWASSGDTLYRRQPGSEVGFEAVRPDIPWQAGRGRLISALADAGGDGLWLGTNIGLFLWQGDGVTTHFEHADESDLGRINDLLVDSSGRLWVAGNGLLVVAPPARASVAGARIWRLDVGDESALPDRAGTAAHLDRYPAFPEGIVVDLASGPDGAIWIACHWGLAIWHDTTMSIHRRSSGLVSDHLSSVLADDAGNSWIGTQSHGLMRINSIGFTSYTEADGLLDRQTSSVTLGPDGETVVVAWPPESVLYVRDDESFVALSLPVPEHLPCRGWGLNQVTFFDHDGRLWVPTPRGLLRFPRLANLRDLPDTRAEHRYLPDDEVFRLFEDSRGDIWMGILGDLRFARWRRSTDTVERFSPADGIPDETATAFAEDRSGAVWIGFFGGSLARWRNGVFELFGSAQGLPSGFVNTLLVDSGGRLWVGAQSGGLAVTDDPEAVSPSWRRTTVADGLASDGVFSLTEDRFGRIYVGSLKGLDRLDPNSGRIDHFDTATGLVNNLVIDALTDPDGDIWLATDGGVSRYRPEPDHPRLPPAVLVDHVSADGVDLAVPIRGVATVPRLTLPAHTSIVEISFTAVDLTPGSHLHYEFAVARDRPRWSPTAGGRTLRLTGLAAGPHTVRVRALTPDGSAGPEATVELEIAAPVWRRWWFIGGVASLLAVMVWLVQRWRMQRLLELEQVRSRIAADLHDEMGLSLARVSILAEVAGRRCGDDATAGTLREIGSTARDLVDATSDMAWALDPRHDTLASLVARLRRTAADVVEGCDARLTVEVDAPDDVPLASEARRHLLLILKEAIRNACRHGRPRAVSLRIELRPPNLVITLADDGIGFDPAVAHDGQGVASMRRRASDMGASLRLEAAPGRGTRVVVETPLPKNA
jgi:ligand-binding sensor domain-containing protein/signal transduction histidine kinase